MRRSQRSRPASLCLALAAALSFGLVQPARAQGDAENAANLRKQVHLRLGATTASGFVAAIRAQAGLDLSLDPALVNRRLIVEEDGLTAGEALADVTELNGWRLRQQDGHLILSRQKAQSTRDLAAIPAAIRAAMPCDLRDFLLVGSEPRDERTGSPFYPSRDPAQVNAGTVRDKLSSGLMARRKELAEAAPRDLLNDRRIPYNDLSPAQRDCISAIIALDLLQAVYVSPNFAGHNVIHGLLTPFQLDEREAMIRLDGDMILVGGPISTRSGTAYTEFGEKLQSPQELPDPLGTGER